jgi:hypothetical protein
MLTDYSLGGEDRVLSQVYECPAIAGRWARASCLSFSVGGAGVGAAASRWQVARVTINTGLAACNRSTPAMSLFGAAMLTHPITVSNVHVSGPCARRDRMPSADRCAHAPPMPPACVAGHCPQLGWPRAKRGCHNCRLLRCGCFRQATNVLTMAWAGRGGPGRAPGHWAGGGRRRLCAKRIRLPAKVDLLGESRPNASPCHNQQPIGGQPLGFLPALWNPHRQLRVSLSTHPSHRCCRLVRAGSRCSAAVGAPAAASAWPTCPGQLVAHVTRRTQQRWLSRRCQQRRSPGTGQT